MPKGYWIANIRVTDPGTYEGYRKANAAPLARHGGRFLARGGRQEVVEGSLHDRTVIVEFPSFAAAKAAYADPEYQAAKEIREAASEGTLTIIEGYEG